MSDKVTLTSSSRMRERQTAARLRELAVQVHANPQVAQQLAHDYTYSNPEALVSMDVRDAAVRMGTSPRAQQATSELAKAKAQAAAAAEAAASERAAEAAAQVFAKDAVFAKEPVPEVADAPAVDGLSSAGGGADMDKIIAMVDSQLSDMRGALSAGVAAAPPGDAPALTTATPQPAPSAPQPAPAASAA
ncbi:MAG: hypothetical protein ABW252_18225 [Polyangiales bacterium]